MDSAGIVGTTVTVGSVSELANILANMPPEQLQNVQLDPILYNALFQTIDTNPQILDGNNQIIDSGTNNESGGVQPLGNEVHINDSNIQLAESLQILQPQLLQNASTITNEQVKQIDLNVSVDPVVSSRSGSVLKINKPSSISQLQSHDVGKSHLHSSKISSSSNAVTSQRNLYQAIPLQEKKTNLTPKGGRHVKKCEVQVTKPNFVKLSNELNLQGRLPGHTSSLIVTPTVMSQVRPTTTIQTMKHRENIIPNHISQVVTLPSNAHLQSNTIQSMKIDNRQVIQVPITDHRISTAIQGTKYGNRIDPKIYQMQQGGKDQVLLDGNLIVSHTIAANGISSQIPVDMEVDHKKAVNTVQKEITMHSMSTSENPLYYSIPTTTLHEGVEKSGHTQSQPRNDICIDNLSKIVLTPQQLSEIMGGKSVEHVLQGTICNQELEPIVLVNSMDLSTGICVESNSNIDFNKIKSSDVQVASVRATEMRQMEPNVFEMKFNGIKGSENHLLYGNTVKPVLSPQKIATASLPTVRKQVVNKNILADHRKIQPLKPFPNLADIKKNLLSISPLKTNVAKTPTSISSVCKESKTVAGNYSKVSTFTPYQYTNATTSYSGIKSIDHQHGKYVVVSGIPANQNTSFQSNKNTWETYDNTMYGKIDNVKEGTNIYKSPIKKNNVSEITSQYHELGTSVSQTKMVSPANVIKSVVHNPVIRNENIKHLNKDFENKKRPYAIVTEKEKKPDIMTSGKVTFSRSFKKTTHTSSGESKKRIKKTLKEMEKTYPKEVSEILHIREAIKSSHVGDGENAMRQLAKLEIENQLKRFSQKVNMVKKASENYFSKSPEKKIDYRRRKNVDHNEINRSNKADLLNQDDTSKREAKDGFDRKTDLNKALQQTKEQVRKRERPKKFDDFVLSSKPKKDKKSKTRKFFFPEDFEGKLSQKSGNDALNVINTLNEEFVSSAKLQTFENDTSENVTLLESKGSRLIGSNNDFTEKEKTDSISRENNDMDDKRDGFLFPHESMDKVCAEEKISSTVSSQIAVEKEEETLKLQPDIKSISPVKKEIEFVTNSCERVFEKKDITYKNILPDNLEERSFLDAISGDTTPTIKNDEKISEIVADVSTFDEDKEITPLEEHSSYKHDVDDSFDHGLAETNNVPDSPTIKDTERDSESLVVADDDTAIPETKTINKVKRKKKKKKVSILFEPEVLPEHLKKKKPIRVEETIIDLSRVQMKSVFIETSFELSDTIQLETFELLRKKDWVCTVCGKPGNVGNLDVLFGPYKVNISDYDNEKNKTFNVWMHRDCAIWTSNIYLSNQALCGLGDALTSAAKMTCSLCSKVGATLECSFRQCRDNYHFVCAKQRGCSFKIENFTIICPKHG